MEKFSLTDIRKMNYSDVYHYIYKNDRTSTQAIANALKMSLPTVGQHLNALTESGLIEKCGQIQSQIGRKATAYSIIPQAKISIGVEILSERILIAAVDLYGEQIGQMKLSITFENQPEYFKKVSQCILDFIQSLSIDTDRVLGIGFGLQGLISQDGAEIIYGKILNCTGLKIDAFQQYLPIPCQFIHDSKCAALTDLWYAPDITDAIYLSIGHHLGGALIIDGNISSGRTGRSGTFEHMTLVQNGRPCYCGQKGCMECYCSVDALLNEDEELEEFFQKKEAGEPDTLKRWDAFLGYLAMAINNLHMVVDCSIILGGHLAPYLTSEDISHLHKLVQENTAFPEDEPFILPGHYKTQNNHKTHVIALGAALPYIREFLNEI